MSVDLVKRVAGALDVPTVGLGFGLVAVVASVVVFGVAPVAVAAGLLALLVVE